MIRPLPPSYLDQNNSDVTAALTCVKEITGNASRVNQTSRERVIFISQLLQRTDALGDVLKALCKETEQSSARSCWVEHCIWRHRRLTGSLPTNHRPNHRSRRTGPPHYRVAGSSHSSLEDHRNIDRKHSSTCSQYRCRSRESRKNRQGVLDHSRRNPLPLKSGRHRHKTKPCPDKQLVDAQLELKTAFKSAATSARLRLEKGAPCQNQASDMSDSVARLAGQLSLSSQNTAEKPPTYSKRVTEMRNIQSNTPGGDYRISKNLDLCSQVEDLLCYETTTAQVNKPNSATLAAE